jgi:VWFA-related protein
MRESHRAAVSPRAGGWRIMGLIVHIRVTMRPTTTRALLLGWMAAAGAGAVLSAGQDPGRRPPAQFRAGVTMVPVDVRVLDRQGRPVTDLAREDFTLLEDGVPQRIEEFLRAEFVAEPSAVMAPLALGPLTGVADRLSPQNRRVFLIVLGRGRQTGPVRIFDALSAFVRERLLPQDQVAVIGYNRATDFTTDHASVAALLERYEEAHTEIEALIAQNQNLVMGVLGPDEMPPFLQDRIDAVFGTGLYGGRTLPEPSAGARRDEARAARMAARAADERAAAAAGPPAALWLDAAGGPLPGLDAAMDAGLLGRYYEDYVGGAVAALTDLGNVHKGLDYLRHVDGEKHLLLVTTEGALGLHDSTDEDRLAARASDARVAFDLIHTGGVVAAPVAGPRGPIQAVPTPSQVFAQTFSVRGMRAMAELSGGQAWAFQTGEHAMTRLDQATRFQYVIGYVPTNADWDGAYRTIRIEVARPDVRVLYRRGYYAVPDEGRNDNRASIEGDQYRRR